MARLKQITATPFTASLSHARLRLATPWLRLATPWLRLATPWLRLATPWLRLATPFMAWRIELYNRARSRAYREGRERPLESLPVNHAVNGVARLKRKQYVSQSLFGDKSAYHLAHKG